VGPTNLTINLKKRSMYNIYTKIIYLIVMIVIFVAVMYAIFRETLIEKIEKVFITTHDVLVTFALYSINNYI